MRVKEIDRTANVAWSPATQHPIYLAAGTAAQQLDATFSTNAALEIYALNLAESGLEMEQVANLPSDVRFHKLVWGSSEMTESCPKGLLMGGADNGTLYVWDADKLISNTDAIVHKLEKHTGAIAALDANPFQSNLIASGASDSEIYIWDLENPSTPMTPGSKSQPPDDVTCVAWNRQVQHILASTYAGRAVVWDLRKNEPIIKVSDSMTRIKCKLVAWHPEVATQMCLASEDDHTPVIQLWDLRFATSPLKVLENHQRGILSIAWCPQDPDLLLSCGKDNRILCWNPNSQVQTGEVVYELPTSNQWSFDVQWCPRNPAVISSCSFDGHVSVYSLMGGTPPQLTPSKVADSFPADPFAHTPTASQTEPTPVALKKPPKWLRQPVGASFGFGGKLVTFESVKPANPQQPAQHLVQISQVVTETELIARSNQLENALNNGQFAEFCSLKIANSKSDKDESIWNFLKVNFESEPRLRYLELLGYDHTQLAGKVSEVTGSDSASKEPLGVDASELANKMATLGTGEADSDHAATGQASPYVGDSQTPTDSETSASDGISAFDQIASVEQDESTRDSPLPFAVNDDCQGLVTRALLTANFEAAVEVCLHENHMAEAIILALAGGPDLLARTQKRFFQKNTGSLNRLISSVVTKDYEHVVRTCELENWKEALAIILTYAKGEEFTTLCDLLGQRLEMEQSGDLGINACLCYICAGDVERLVACWGRLVGGEIGCVQLQDLVEKVMVLRKAVETVRGQSQEIGSALAQKLSSYADLLAAQGSLTTAINYLGASTEPSLAVLRDRLYCALAQPGAQLPAKPFNVVDVQAEGARPVAQLAAVQTSAAQAPAARQRSSSGFYQATAGSNFNTTTVPSSTYNTPTSQYVHGYSQPTSTYSTTSAPYTPQDTTYAQQPSPAQYATGKATLSQKYPTSTNANYSQPGYQSSQYLPQDTQPSATSQPQVYNPAAMAAPVSQQTPDEVQDESDDFLQSSSSSLEKLRLLFSKPEAAAGIMGLGRRRSSAYSDSESIAGTIGSISPSRHQIQDEYITEKEHSTSGAPYAPPSSVSQAPLEPSFQEMKPQGAWNDPPALKDRRKKKEVPVYQPQTPITQPIVGVPASTNQPPMPQGRGMQEQSPPGAPNYSGMGQVYNPQQYVDQQRQQNMQQQVPVAPAAPAPPKPKAPIPAEHQVLHDILDSLANQCLGKASNAQMKRKLEDVLRKLETLYDKLRDQSLSSSVIQGLHQMIAAIKGCDYQSGLAYHTQMVSQGNFSEISSFMPGIKVLMQTAWQQGVFVQT